MQQTVLPTRCSALQSAWLYPSFSRSDDEHDNEGIENMNEIGKEVHVVDLCLDEKGRIEIDVDYASDLNGHPHGQVQRRDDPQLQDESSISTPFQCLLPHGSSLNEHTDVEQIAEDRNGQQRTVVVEEEIDIGPGFVTEVARPCAQQLRVVVVVRTRTDEYGTDVEHRWIDETEENWAIVKETLSQPVVK